MHAVQAQTVGRKGLNDGDGCLRRVWPFRHSLEDDGPVVTVGGWKRLHIQDLGPGSNGPSGWPGVVEVVYCIQEPATEIASG